MFRSALIVLVAVAGTCFAAECPLFDAQGGLDLPKQLGTWQVHGLLRNSAPVGPIQCLTQDITGVIGNAPVNLDLMMMGTNPETGDMIHETGKAIVQDLTFPGIWDVTMGSNGAQSTGFILFSDYVDYSLEVKCDNDGNVDALFMSRYHDAPPDTVINNFKAILTQYGVDLTEYISIYHDHMVCGH